MASISSPGIGSNLDVNGIVSKLMQVESQPLTVLATKEASYQAKLSAFGSLQGALSGFQSSFSQLVNASKFQAMTANTSDASVATVTATEKATTGSYNLNVSQLAASQSLSTRGQASSNSAIGTGVATKITFQFGSIGFGPSGNKLSDAVAAGGIAAGALSINGTPITTSASTNSAKALAAQINLVKGTTGVTANVVPTDTGLLSFSNVAADTGDSWSLSADGVAIASLTGPGSFTAAQLDSALADSTTASALAAKGIKVEGSAAKGTLKLMAADGSNIELNQTLSNVSGNAAGGVAGLASGVTKVYTSAVSLYSDRALTVAGNDPSLAGLAAGDSKLVNGQYINGAFTLDASQTTGTITINGDNSLQGIRDAINKAGMGVTASIINDGSDSPYRLVLTSTKTGAKSAMKITVDGDGDIASLLSNDPAGTQNLTQTVAAQNTVLTVNGLTINSANNTVTDAIQGTTVTVSKTGTTTVNVARDTTSVSSLINGFVNSYNTLQGTISQLSGYDATKKIAGQLNGDATVRLVQSRIRSLLTTPLSGTNGAFTNLTQIGIGFAKDGTMTLDSGKLQTAISNNFNDIGSLFAKMATTSDSLVSYKNAATETQTGNYALTVTQLATQGKMTGGVDLTANPIVVGADAAVNVTLDGNTSKVTLTAGSYTASQFAAMLQSAINGTATFSSASSSVSASIDPDGKLVLQSARYGSASNISLGAYDTDTTASVIGGGSASKVSTGLDVAGTIGGYAATGSGQTLKGASGTPGSGLEVSVSGGSTGDRGKISYSQGYAFSLDAVITGFLGTQGAIAANTKSINDVISDIGKQRTRINDQLTAKQKYYLAQFTALDASMSQMTQTQNYLTQQLAQIAANSKSSSN